MFRMRNEDLYHEVNDEQYRDQWRNGNMGAGVTVHDKINDTAITVKDTVIAYELRDYQESLSAAGDAILKEYGIVMYCFEPRVGKTGTALNTALLYGAKTVLFLTKKIAITSIEQDRDRFAFDLQVTVTNYENMHNIEGQYDLYVCDESHKLGQFPLPANKTALLKTMCKGKPVILLSATPTPETYTSFYHQFYISSFSPWAEWTNFYSWAKRFVTIQPRTLNKNKTNDYSNDPQITINEYKYSMMRKGLAPEEKQRMQDIIDANTASCLNNQEKILSSVNHLMLTYTQEQAAFYAPVEEEILYVPMSERQIWIINKLKKDKIAVLQSGAVILADTMVKERNKIHQCCSGTVKDEDGNGIEFDTTKADFIKHHFAGKKIVIFYKYIMEGQLLSKVFDGNVYVDPIEFEKAGSDAVFIAQIISGREGISLASADSLVNYNIDYAAVSYFQTRARIQTRDRTAPAKVYWIFTKGGIEDEIYECVKDKKEYTLSHYRENRKREAAKT